MLLTSFQSIAGCRERITQLLSFLSSWVFFASKLIKRKKNLVLTTKFFLMIVVFCYFFDEDRILRKRFKISKYRATATSIALSTVLSMF